MSNKSKMIVEEKIKGMTRADKLKADKIYNKLVKGLEKQTGGKYKTKGKGMTKDLSAQIMRGDGCGCGSMRVKGGEVSASGASMATMANHIPYAEQTIRTNDNLPIVGSAYYMGRGQLNYGPTTQPIEIGISYFKPN